MTSLQRLLQQGYLETAVKEWKDFLKAGWRPNAALYSIILMVLAKQGDKAQFLKTWSHMVNHSHIQPNAFHYHAKVQCYCSIGHLSAAEATIQDMIQQKIVPHFSIWTALLKGYRAHDPQSPRVEEIYTILRQDDQNTPTITTIMMEIQVHKDVQQAIDYLEKLKSENLLNEGVFNALIAGCKDHDLAQKYLKEMEDAGFKRSSWTCNSLLQAYADSPEKLTQIFDEYRANKLVEPRSYVLYASKIASHGDLDAIKNALAVLQADAVPYTGELFGEIFKELQNCENWEIIGQVHDLMKQYKVKLKGSTYKIIIAAYGKHGRLAEMHNTFEEMRLQSFPSFSTMSLLIDIAYNAERYDMVTQYYQFALSREMEPPEHILATVLVSYAMMSNWNQINIILARYKLAHELTTILIDTLGEKSPELLHTFYFKVNKVFPMCTQIFAILVAQERHAPALEILRDIMDNQHLYQKPSFDSYWNNLLQNIVLLSDLLEKEAYTAGVQYLQYAVNKINEFKLSIPKDY